jgi:hypothetical protein
LVSWSNTALVCFPLSAILQSTLKLSQGGTKNTVEARSHYESAGEGCIAALYNYGYCLFTGIGQFEMAIIEDHTKDEIMCFLACPVWLGFAGTGGGSDKEKAREYFHMAALSGYPPALNNLAFCFQVNLLDWTLLPQFHTFLRTVWNWRREKRPNCCWILWESDQTWLPSRYGPLFIGLSLLTHFMSEG